MRNVRSGCRLGVIPSAIALLLLSVAAGPAYAQNLLLVDTNSMWRVFKGTAEASPADRTAWRTASFPDAPWTESRAPFWYGEAALFGGTGTEVPDMQNSFSTLFLRRKFTVPNPSVFDSLEFRAICDDGFIAWINGKQIATLNPPAGEPTASALASANVAEPVALTPYPVPNPLSALVAGENVLAVQVFNTGLGSSDIVFDAALNGIVRPSESPFVTRVDPPSGPLSTLNRISVTFSEPVRGVEADDFLVNGVSATRVEGSGSFYTFTFDQPPFGPVEIRWGTLHAIEDFETPPRRFEITGPGSVWGYELMDPLGPSVLIRQPPAGAVVSAVTQVEVTFDKAVIGVDASSLLRGGIAATNVTGIGAGPYLFEFPGNAPAGNVSISFARDHGIQSDAFEPHPFSGSSWSYTVNPVYQAPGLRIAEFMAENLTAYRDEDLDPEDWIEIQNPTATSVSLEGWSLSNDPDDPGLWAFPAVSLPPGGYLVVHASAKDRRPVNPALRLHTNFKLNPNGGYLGLFAPQLPRRAVSEVRFPEQGPNHSFARENNTGEWRYFLNGSPGAPNGTSPIRSAVEEVRFSVPRGFFTGTFNLALTCPTPGATIRYTTNGSPPTLTDGFTYSNAIPITINRVIRAAAFKSNALPSRIETHTYLVNQTTTRLRVPALSLVTATNNLYGRTGIMEVSPRNTTKRGAAWERPVSVEWIRPEDNDGFQADCGLRIQGGDYVRGQYNYKSSDIPFSKYSFRLYFRGEYGKGRLEYPLFPETTQTSFDTIVLRAGMNDAVNPFLTDEFVRSIIRDTGQPSPVGTFVHFFLNGVYKGYYNPCERVDVDFLRAYHGGGEKWDLMAQFGEVREGDATAWNTLRTVATSRDLTQPANFRDIASRLDLTNFVDYLLPLIYVDNDDWPHNNWRAARERVTGGRYRFYCWDAEWAFGFVNGHAPTWDTIRNQLSSTSPPWGGADIQRLYLGLRKSPEFRQFFADRAHRHLFNDGVLTDERLRARYAGMTNRLSGIVPSLNTRIATTWIPQRRRNVLLHLERAGLLASSNAPAFSQFGGLVPEGFRLSITNLAGTIYLTTNGTDPRVAFTGEVSPEARPYSNPIPLLAPTFVRARTLEGTNWSALTEAEFQIRRITIPIEFSEIMYNPPGGDAFEFLELHNSGALPVDLSGFSLGGIGFRFPEPSAPMPPGAHWVIANRSRPAEFAARYPAVTVAGWFDGSLNNGGERLELRDRDGVLVTAVEYDDDAPWPTDADGNGASLEHSAPGADPHDPANWRDSTAVGGSPGLPNPPTPLPPVRLSEITAALAPAADWIELHNAGTTPVSLANWSVSDQADIRRFVFPTGTSLSPNSRLRLWCDTNSAAGGLHSGFALSRKGETLALYDASSRRVDAVTFGHLPEGFSLGRVGASQDWNLTEPTPLAANEAAALAPVSQIRVNEWLANPPAGAEDWIELHNLSATLPVALNGLHISTSNAVHQFRALSFIAPGGFLVLHADEKPGPDHLDLRLPANAGAIALADSGGNEFSRVTYRLPMPGAPLGTEGISLGRIPDGVGEIVAFPGTASPEAPNYLSPLAGPRFSEFMAAAVAAVRDPAGLVADWIEIQNSSGTEFDLSGSSLSVGNESPGAWRFPAGTRLPAGGFLVVWCDPSRPASTNAATSLNTGFGLPAEGSTLWLFNPGGQRLDSVRYGSQLPDLSVGRTPFNTWALLASPTPGSANAGSASLAGSFATRINEWNAHDAKANDWVELYNPESLPADLGGHFLTDDPSVAGTVRFQMAPLTLIPARGHLLWHADDQADRGPDHLPFHLNADGGTLRLYAPNRSLIDSVSYEPQRQDVASGRFPDGADSVMHFPGSNSPGEANWLVHPGLVISEVLAHTDPPLEDAIELYNQSPRPIILDGWRVSNAARQLDKYRIPPGTILQPGGRLVLYEKDFNVPGSPTAFTLNSAHGDDLWVSEISSSGEPTGLRAFASFGASANGISFGRFLTSRGWSFPPLSRLTFGRDLPLSLEEFRRGTGLPNAYPLVGPVVISEILHSPMREVAGALVPSPDDEYIELHNLGSTSVPLFDPAAPTNTWRIRGGVDFTFPPNTTLPAHGFALVVRFSPAGPEAADFRARRRIPVSVPLFGPFRGSLSANGDDLRLERPDAPQKPPAPDAGFVPYLLVEQVAYLSGPTWPSGGSTAESSLQRRRLEEYANDPVNWIATVPTPGTPTQPPLTDPDFDGIPSDWEIAHGLNPSLASDAALDSDGDGLSNLAEFLAGTDPRDPASALTLRASIKPSAGAVITFRAVAHRSYSLLRRDDAAFGVWQKVADLSAEDFDRDVAVPLGLPDDSTGILKLVTPAAP